MVIRESIKHVSRNVYLENMMSLNQSSVFIEPNQTNQTSEYGIATSSSEFSERWNETKNPFFAYLHQGNVRCI